METQANQKSPSAPASATPTTSSQSESFSDDITKIAAKICSRPVPPEESPVDLDQVERRRRHDDHKQLLKPMGVLYENCTSAGYVATTDKQTRLVAALRAYAEDMPAEVEAGNGIVLFGSSGTGKDHLLAALTRTAIITHGMSVVWKNGMDLYGEMRDNIRNDKAEKETVAALVKPDILYISDPLPPSGDLTPYQAAMLQRILDGRIRNRRPCWVSMNVQGSAEADRRMGPALVDRLKPGAICCHCDWKSYRQPRMV